jgi:RND family efflux transporter MFP subunit
MSTNISTAVPGTIARIFAKDGALVKAGDPLVRLDDRVIAAGVERHKAMLAMDQAQLDDANETLERVNSLTRTGAESKQQGDDALAAAKQAKAAMEVDQANLAADSALLAQTEINAPFDGQLGAVRLSPGAYVAPGTTIVTLTQMKPVYGEFTLSETDLALARASHAAGMLSGEFSPMLLGDNSDRSAIGPIVFIDNTVDPVSATFKMRALLPNDDETLWPGQSVNVLVDAGTVDNLVLVPLVAIQSLDQGNICYVVKPDQTIEIRNVDVALRVGNNAGIVHGLADGELVVVEGQASLEEGTAVVVQKAKTATSEPAASVPRIVK